MSVPIGIAYKEDIEHARRVMLSTTQSDERVETEPPPSVGVSACSASSVDLSLGFWIRDESLEKGMASEYLEKIKYALDAAGIEIPFPHVQLVVAETGAIEKMAGNSMMRKAG